MIEKMDLAEELKKLWETSSPIWSECAKTCERPLALPWPFEDASVQEITCMGILEYVPGRLRGAFMDEIYRILVPKGKLAIGCLYWTSSLSYHDYRFEWPPLAEQSFLIFNKEWRTNNKKVTNLQCDFDFNYGFNWDPETATRNNETQAFHAKHYNNAAVGLQVLLVKR